MASHHRRAGRPSPSYRGPAASTHWLHAPRRRTTSADAPPHSTTDCATVAATSARSRAARTRSAVRKCAACNHATSSSMTSTTVSFATSSPHR
eukprot:scaffold50788_cov68-Phaeocystis_antarctica.AAC.1